MRLLTVYLQHHIAVDQMTVALGEVEAYNPLVVYCTHIFSVEIRLAECELYSLDHFSFDFHATSMLLRASVSLLLKKFLNTALVYNLEMRVF